MRQLNNFLCAVFTVSRLDKFTVLTQKPDVHTDCTNGSLGPEITVCTHLTFELLRLEDADDIMTESGLSFLATSRACFC